MDLSDLPVTKCVNCGIEILQPYEICLDCEKELEKIALDMEERFKSSNEPLDATSKERDGNGYICGNEAQNGSN